MRTSAILILSKGYCTKRVIGRAASEKHRAWVGAGMRFGTLRSERANILMRLAFGCLTRASPS